MGIGWNFPGNNNGKITGISEAGIETFRGKLFSSLAKEICQNSLDARVDYTKPVKVEFYLKNILTKNIDNFDELVKAMQSCYDFWQDNKKTANFFDKAIKVCSGKKINVLRISDFNTTGLTGSLKERSSAWQNLVKSSGVSDKSGMSGGSYGIGKSAPFACSDLRTVYYSTKDIEGISAYQGVANLVSFNKEGSGFLRRSEVTQGIGYYGNTKDNSPVFELLNLDGFIRKEAGTDIYILGFISSDTWKSEIIKSVLEGFLLSILHKDIVIKVGDITINNKTLKDLMELYKDDISLAYNYYQVMTSEKTTHIQQDFMDMGNVSLYVLLQRDFKRKVLMSRNNGMKIFDKDRISGSIQFAGVCILEGEKLNAFFREMETPQHNNWEEDRHTNRSRAKKVKTELYRFIKNKIVEIGKESVSAEMDISGAGDYIPDIGALDKKIGQESIESKVNSIEFEEINDTKIVNQDQIIIENGNLFGIYENEIKGKRSRKNKIDSKKINENKNEKDIIDKQNNVNEPDIINSIMSENENLQENSFGINLLKLRLFLFDKEKNIYKLTFVPNKDAQYAYVEINLLGEYIQEKINILEAKSSELEDLQYFGNRIYLGYIVKKKPYTIYFKYENIASMEVFIYGYKK